jgi:hypothetical protein
MWLIICIFRRRGKADLDVVILPDVIDVLATGCDEIIIPKLALCQPGKSFT